MYGSHQQQALPFAEFAFGVFEVADLHHHRETLDQEHAAQQRQQQFLADAEGEDGDDAADRQGAGVTHEDLRREGVVPQEADQRPREGRREDDQLSAVGDIHDVEVVGVDDMPREVGQYAEYCHDRDGDARGQPVEAVGEVGAIRHRRDDEDRHQHVEQPRGGAGFAREPSVVEFVVLDEGMVVLVVLVLSELRTTFRCTLSITDPSGFR